MKDKSTRDPSQEQLLDRTFRTSDGESAEQTRERMNNYIIKKESDIMLELEENSKLLQNLQKVLQELGESL